MIYDVMESAILDPPSWILLFFLESRKIINNYWTTLNRLLEIHEI